MSLSKHLRNTGEPKDSNSHSIANYQICSSFSTKILRILSFNRDSKHSFFFSPNFVGLSFIHNFRIEKVAFQGTLLFACHIHTTLSYQLYRLPAYLFIMFFSKTTLALALATNLSFLSSSTLAAEHGAKQRVPRAQRRSLKAPKASKAPTQKPPCKKVKKLLEDTTFWEIVSGPDGKKNDLLTPASSVGSKFFINGHVYSNMNFTMASGTYNQMCTIAVSNTTTIFENFCEYNFCLDVDEHNKGCIMLRSGGPYLFKIPSGPSVATDIPVIDAFIYGGTGCLKGVEGSAMIEATVGTSVPTAAPTDTYLKLVLEHFVSSNSMMV